MTPSPAEVLRLIEQAALSMQGREHPGRPMFTALGRLYEEARRARREAQRSGAEA